MIRVWPGWTYCGPFAAAVGLSLSIVRSKVAALLNGPMRVVVGAPSYRIALARLVMLTPPDAALPAARTWRVIVIWLEASRNGCENDFCVVPSASSRRVGSVLVIAPEA